MKTYTMRPFDYKKAYENRFLLDVKEGDKVICRDNNNNKYQVVKVIMPDDKNDLPHYILTPIEETLKEEKKSYDNAAKKNRYTMTVGKYPDFSFEIGSTWFFSRDVIIEEE